MKQKSLADIIGYDTIDLLINDKSSKKHLLDTIDLLDIDLSLIKVTYIPDNFGEIKCNIFDTNPSQLTSLMTMIIKE